MEVITMIALTLAPTLTLTVILAVGAIALEVVLKVALAVIATITHVVYVSLHRPHVWRSPPALHTYGARGQPDRQTHSRAYGPRALCCRLHLIQPS